MVNSDRFKGGEIFNDLTNEELDKIAVICALEDFKKGDTVILSWEPAERFFLLEKGAFSVTFPIGAEIVIDKPGSLAGWSSLVSPYRYLGSMKCLEDCRFLVVPSRDFPDIVTAEASIGFKVMQRISSVISDRLRLVAKGEQGE